MSNDDPRKQSFTIAPGGRLNGRCRVPGDKSISHRGLMLGAIADGTTRIHGFLESADCLATLDALRRLGLDARREDHTWSLAGAGIRGLAGSDSSLDLGNSGTSMRLLAGVLAGQSFDSRLIGDASLCRRPMRRVIDPLTRMGAVIEGSDNDCAPLVIRGGRSLTAIDYTPPVASAQIKSCVLLAGLYAEGTTTVHEPGVSRDHTERMLTAFGVAVARQESAVSVTGGQSLAATDVTVPADLSSAAFFLVGATIAADSDLWLTHVGVNPTRRGVIDCLLAMGADIELHDERLEAGEPVADLRVRSAPLTAVDIGADEVELAIDELPVLCVAAACARGTTTITGAAELRVKESDRIAVVADGLAALGVAVTVNDDGLTIAGSDRSEVFDGGAIASHGDHRIAMAFSMAALRARAPIVIDDCGPVETSFPGFAALARGAGLDIESS